MFSKRLNKSAQVAIQKITEEHLLEENFSEMLSASRVERAFISESSNKTAEELEAENMYLTKLGNILIKEIRQIRRDSNQN